MVDVSGAISDNRKKKSFIGSHMITEKDEDVNCCQSLVVDKMQILGLWQYFICSIIYIIENTDFICGGRCILNILSVSRSAELLRF